MERKSEWTSEGEQKRVTGVWETEKTLRDQMSAYDSMHERVMNITKPGGTAGYSTCPSSNNCRDRFFICSDTCPGQKGERRFGAKRRSKMKKKLVALMLSASMVFALAGCGEGAAQSTAEPAASTSESGDAASADGATFKGGLW